MRNKKNIKGFTLIEMTIFIVALSFLTAGFSAVFTTYLASKERSELKLKTDNIEKALVEYLGEQGQFPCPAPKTGPDMGVPGNCNDPSEIAVGPTNCVNGVCVALGDDGERIRIGALPFADENLDLSLIDVIDPRKNLFTYAVTERLATPSYATGLGNVKVNSTKKNPNTNAFQTELIDDAEFVFFSHGRDGVGAYTINGVLQKPCSGTGADLENCDNDAEFTSTEETSHVSGISEHFDDELVFKLEFADLDLICPEGKALIGVTNGVADCADIEPPCTNDGFVMVGYKTDGTPDCRDLTNFAGDNLAGKSCSGSEIVAGFKSDGSLDCVTNTSPPPPPPPSCPPCPCGPCGQIFETCTTTQQCHCSGWVQIGFGKDCTCFIGTTMITMADGTGKPIKEIAVGDVVLGQDGAHNVVQEVLNPIKKPGHKLYAFNGGEYFVTADHPFMTTKGWKSIDPDFTKMSSPNMDVSALSVGDTLITKDGEFEITQIDEKSITKETPTYNLRVTGGTYYADGYLVSDYQDRGTQKHASLAE